MILYHGTKVYFDNPDLSYAKQGKDFGKGFYLTTNPNQAKEWAIRNDGKGYVFVYEFPEELLYSSELKVKELSEYNKEWADFVCQCRIELYETDDDIIYDRMADSRHNKLIKALEQYHNKLISLKKLLKIAVFSDVEYDQYCFKTNKAINTLRRIEVITYGGAK